MPPKKKQPSVTDTFKVTKKPRGKSGKRTKQDADAGAEGEEAESPKKKKRQVNRFNGMSEEEVAKRGLPDYLKHELDVVFIGINPSLAAAYTGPP